MLTIVTSSSPSSSYPFFAYVCSNSMYRGMGPPIVGVTPIFALSFWYVEALSIRISFSLYFAHHAHVFLSDSSTMQVLRPRQKASTLLLTQLQYHYQPLSDNDGACVRRLLLRYPNDSCHWTSREGQGFVTSACNLTFDVQPARCKVRHVSEAHHEIASRRHHRCLAREGQVSSTTGRSTLSGSCMPKEVFVRCLQASLHGHLCILTVWLSGLIRSLFPPGSIWRGTGATLARDGPGSAAYFVAYEAAKKALTPVGSDPSKLNLTAVILAGGTAGVAMWSIAIPPDVSCDI